MCEYNDQYGEQYNASTTISIEVTDIGGQNNAVIISQDTTMIAVIAANGNIYKVKQESEKGR